MVEITLLGGLVGGLVATLVMTAFMLALGDDSPPPTSLYWSKYVGDDDPDAYRREGMALHMVYGIGAGVVLTAALQTAGFGDVAPLTAMGAGLGYGILLFAGGAAFWMKVVLALDPTPEDIGQFLFFHLVYGLVLGGVLAAGVV